MIFKFFKKTEPEEVVEPAEVIPVEVVDGEEIFDLGKPLTCLMLTCKGCHKIDPADGCIAYEDPSLLPWHRQDLRCPVHPYNPTAKKKKKKTNPLKESKRKARQEAA
jgi:hypothetical protein